MMLYMLFFYVYVTQLTSNNNTKSQEWSINKLCARILGFGGKRRGNLKNKSESALRAEPVAQISERTNSADT
jgi:hypothetical protein